MTSISRCASLAAAILVAFAPVTTHAEDFETSALAGVAPGTILRVWPLLGGVRPGYKGYKILYRSTGVGGAPVAVTGAVMFPADAGNAEARDVIAWAHPTTGVATKCAPTLLPDLSGTVMGIDRMTDRKVVIVATDYVGLGTDDHHPYLVGDAAAHAVLDSVRAARQLKDARAGNRFAVWGHSQGGHAALFTGALAASYAPDLHLVGVAAAAPATDLIALFSADRDTASGRSLTSMALLSWTRVFGLPLEDFVRGEARRQFDALANDCIESLADFFKEDRDEKALMRQFLIVDPVQDSDLRALMAKNSTGDLPRGTPVFIAQGTADEVVRPDVTKAYVERICGKKVKVKLQALPGGSHMLAGRDSADVAVGWMMARFRGERPPDDC